MFPIQDFMNGLDRLYQSGQIEQVESYLLQGLAQTKEKEKDAALLILNELIGYYRVMSRYQEGAECTQLALEIIKDTGMEGTLNHGTTLLNAATGYRAAGDCRQAEECYKTAQGILEKFLLDPDFRLATLYNNMGLLYSQMDKLTDAQEYMLKALKLTEQLAEREKEKAVTLTNLGNLCFRLNQPEQAGEYMKKAADIFEQFTGRPDPHYPAALSGLAQVRFHFGDLQEAAELYQRTLSLIEQIYGRNDDWAITKSNLDMVTNLILRREMIVNNKMKGLDLARAYYQEVGKPMLEQKYPEYIGHIATGLVGEGSECLGFDDYYSTDHDFGPGFCIWLTAEDYKAIGKKLQADYDALPKEWNGFPVRNTTAEGANRVGVFEIDSFYSDFTGYADAPKAQTIQDISAWIEMQPEMLRTAVNGEVFSDPLGEFSARRVHFSKYPEPVRLYRLAQSLSKMAQAGQYNYPRAKKRKDIGMMYSSLAEFVQAAAETGYLLNHSYMPFYKWRIRGMEQFTAVAKLKPMLEAIMSQKADSDTVENEIETICAYIRTELAAQGISDSKEEYLEYQKNSVLKHISRAFDIQNKTERENKMENLFDVIPESKKKLVQQVVAEEWKQFREVKNEGGQADCQHNWPTFEIMRTSQFYTWNEETLRSYLDDLNRAEQTGWNLVMEKYARMMEHTAPREYEALEKELPVRSEKRKELQNQLVSIYMQWTREMHEKYPDLTKRGRHISADEDSQWDTSSETYLQGELGTYSETTIQLYARMMVERLKREENPVEENMNYMVHFYGYHSLQEANDRYAQK